MIKFVLKKNNNESSGAFGKYYAYPVVEETMDLEALAQHMEEHNSGFSEAMCVGVLKAMVKCIKEQLLSGKNVKIDNLAIFSCGIRNKQGAASEEEFTVSNNIEGIKLRARATGMLSNANLNLQATLHKASTVLSTSGSGNGGNDGGGESNMFTLTVTSGDPTKGSVTGGGSYAQGSTATITATPASGYEFSSWSDGNTSASRTITVTGNLSLTATFRTADSGGGGGNDDLPMGS